MAQGRLPPTHLGFDPSSSRFNGTVFTGFFALAILPTLTRTSLGVVHGLPLWLATLALVNSRRAALLTLPCAICLPAVLYYQHVYRLAPGASLWLILIDSSLSETAEYLECQNGTKFTFANREDPPQGQTRKLTCPTGSNRKLTQYRS